MKNVRILLTLFLAFSLTNIFAQKSNQVGIIANWNLNDSFSYNISLRTETNNISPISSSINSKIILTIVDSTESGYKIKALYSGDKEALISIISELEESITETQLDELMKPDTIYYNTDWYGLIDEESLYLAILNASESQTQKINLLADILKIDELDDLSMLFNAIWGKPFDYLTLIHKYTGYYVKYDKPAKGTTFFNSALGAIKGDYTLQVTELDREKNQVVEISVTSKAKDNEMKKYLKQIAKLYGISKKEVEKIKMEINEFSAHKYDLQDGMLLNAKYMYKVNTFGEDASESSSVTIISRILEK